MGWDDIERRDRRTTDEHTASGQRMGEHQIVLGTSRRRTASAMLIERLVALFEGHGFRCDVDVPGYAGAHIVRTFGAHQRPDTDAVQIEVSAGLLQTMPHDQFIRTQIDGCRPAPDAEALVRLRAAIAELVLTCDEHARSAA